MSRFRAPLGLPIWLALLSLLLDAGCSRPNGLNSAESGATDPHEVPFRDADGKVAADAPANVSSASLDKPSKGETDLPFRDLQNLPAGTLLTVRLRNPVSADSPEASGIFEAVVDEPVTVEGNTLVPRGTTVAGRVESARTSKMKGNGYVRLTLDSIAIAGKDLHLQTSSLFARGNTAGRGPTLDPLTLRRAAA